MRAWFIFCLNVGYTVRHGSIFGGMVGLDVVEL